MMKVIRFATIVVAMTLSLSAKAQTAPAEKVYSNSVNRDYRAVSQTFKPQNAEHVAVLRTKPSALEDKFKADTGKVAASKRHGEAIWVESKDEEKLHEAKSPPIPENQTSWVICKGQFAPKKAEGEGAAQAIAVAQKDANWKSSIVEPGAHVIIVNIYNTAKDQRQIGAGLTPNSLRLGSAKALKQELSMGGAETIHFAVCGKTTQGETMVPELKDLATYITSLQIGAETLSTFTTVGHGGSIFLSKAGVPQKGEYFMEYAQAAENGKDMVGNGDFHAIIFDVTTITGPIAPLFIKSGGIVSLDHCFTGATKATKTVNGRDFTFNFVSNAKRVKNALPDETVTGHGKYVLFRSDSGGTTFYPPASRDGDLVVIQ